MNNEAGLVDVIIPVFNGEKTVAQALQSVLAQTKGLVRQIIVIDDGSIDGSADAVNALGIQNLELVQTENRGVAAARNLGIEHARAEWIAFLDADDLWEPDKLTVQLTAASDYRVGFICSATNLSTNRSASHITPQTLRSGNFIATSSVLVKRDVLSYTKPAFTPGMAFAEDYLAWLKCLTITHGFYIPEPLVKYHVSELPRYRWGMILKNLLRMNLHYAAYLRSENKSLKERTTMQFFLVLGSFRSILSIVKRFLASQNKRAL